MKTQILIGLLLVLLFLLIYIFVHYLLQALLLKARAKVRLYAGRRKNDAAKRGSEDSLAGQTIRHLADLLSSLGMNASPGLIAAISVILLSIGIVAGALYFSSVKGIVVLGLIFGCLPYVWLRIKLTSLHMRIRLELLSAVEVFYQAYVLAPQKNIRSVLHGALQAERIQYPARPLFEQLYRNLMIASDPEEGLRIFSIALGSVWGDYFVNILRYGLLEGLDITENLQELIADMRKAKRSDQMERNRLLEIRIANFTPIFFLVVFLGINFRMNPTASYHYYVLDAAGRDLLLNALLLIFASFVMGIFLSMKRM